MKEALLAMNEQELFCVLTGSRGIMARAYLQQTVQAYRAAFGSTTDLETMVQTMLTEPVRDAS